VDQEDLLRIVRNSFPAQLNGPRKIGCEEEFLVTDAEGNPADCRILFTLLGKMGWKLLYDDIYPKVLVGARDPQRNVTITTDAGWAVLEVIFPPHSNLHEAAELYDLVIDLIVTVLQKQGQHLLGLGVQPKLKPDADNWAKKGRYDAVRGLLPEDVNRITMSASTQVHIDLTQDEMVPAAITFNALTGVIIGLFANSPITQGQLSLHKALRGLFWDSLVPRGSHRHGLIQECEDLTGYLRQTALGEQLFLIRFNEQTRVYEPLPPGTRFQDYIAGIKDEAELVEAYRIHESFLWFSSRLRQRFGTLEIRPACQQPREARLALAAFSLGLAEMLPEAYKTIKHYTKRYGWDIWQKFYINATQNGLQARVWDIPIARLAGRVLELAKTGLEKRKQGEEEFLEPLFDRLRQGELPADQVVRVFQEGGIPAVVKHCSYQTANVGSRTSS